MTGSSSVSEVRIKGDCPNCGPKRWADVKGHVSQHEEDAEAGIWSQTDYRLLQCPACETVYFQTDYVFSEDTVDYTDPVTGEHEYDYAHKIEHWPSKSKTAREKPEWIERLFYIDEGLERLLSTVYTALDHELRVLAAIGIRTVFDRASELIGIDPAISFEEKLDALVTAGRIGSEEKDTLTTLTDAGNAAAHRGWEPTRDELDSMMSMLEGFLYRTFFLGEEAKKLRLRIPPKPKRRRKEK